MAFPLNRMARSDDFLARLDAADQTRRKLQDTGPPVYSEGLPSVVAGDSMQQTAMAGPFARAVRENPDYFPEYLKRLDGFNSRHDIA